eukprot:TRINITY_DN3278_c0_g1_i4.p1 TRINITY_DN3278_c0_g1~~TRINITY_DN3278_c0_g1_i4.p1  ORF type:complete len:508 (+),score=123.06 TRINITY_DN3278_c0_g1_i4:64-1524(+)
MPPSIRSELWRHVTEPGPQKWVCPGCHQTKSGALKRLVAHMTGEGCSDAGISACSKAGDIPEAARKVAAIEAKRIAQEKQNKIAAAERKKQREAAAGKQKQPRLTESFSGEFSDLADQALVKLMAVNGVPFRLAESDELREFVEAVGRANTIRPYKPCNRQKAAGAVLDQVHEQLERDQLEPLQEQQQMFGSTIMSDGLTDKRKRPLLNFLLATPGHEYVVSVEDASGHSKTHEYIVNELLAPIVGDNTNIDLVTMDGANAGALKLCEQRWPWMSGVICLTHSISLIFSDLDKDPWYGALFKEGRKMATFWRGHHATTHLLREQGLKTCLLPAETRFAGVYLMLQRQLDIREELRRAVGSSAFDTFRMKQKPAKRNSVVDPIKRAIMGDEYWDRVSFFLSIAKPVFKMLRRSDSNEPFVADVIPEYVKMINAITAAAEKYINKDVDEEEEPLGGEEQGGVAQGEDYAKLATVLKRIACDRYVTNTY